MGEKQRRPSQGWVYDAIGLSPVYERTIEKIFKQSRIWDGVLEQQRLYAKLGSSVRVTYPFAAAAASKDVAFRFDLGIPKSGWLTREFLGPDPFGLSKYSAVAITPEWAIAGRLGPDPFGLNKFAAAAGVHHEIAKTARLGALAHDFGPNLGVANGVLSSLFGRVKAPLAPGLPQQVEKLAELLLPVNLQGFSDAEWERLIDIAATDGIGLMWAPSTRHLRALLAEAGREGRYAYLLRHLDELLDELSAGLQEVTQEPLQDLVRLGNRAIECARAGLWEGALAVATNVLYSAMETHGIRWYRQEFNGVRDHNNQPIQGMTGPNQTLQFVLRHVPMPERRVGIFELSAHLVIRPMANTFQKSTLVREQHNRHAVCHEASYDSFREEYLLPALLNMHALLRGLDEKMEEDSNTS
ncbi:hypothetical protein ACH4VM_34005 [Streptomyces sp. NPDC020792]|uniref:hypothetical protein n=1 Tax=Streptomyces sp. NPDC020792 TaxID=3365089 RepID=UPI00379F68D3